MLAMPRHSPAWKPPLFRGFFLLQSPGRSDGDAPAFPLFFKKIRSGVVKKHNNLLNLPKMGNISWVFHFARKNFVGHAGSMFYF
jgi:hypothetical protein